MSTLSHAEIKEMASKLTYPTQAFIGGKFVPSLSGKTMSTVNPATGKVLAEFAACGVEDVDLAVSIGRKVFQSGVWSRMHPTARKRVLSKYADLIEKYLVELSILESLDSGKPVSDCMSVDLPESIHAMRWHAEFADKNYGLSSPSGYGAVGTVIKEALGVVACIIPWNFPLMTTVWKLAPALSEGNSIIIKPAGITTLSTLRLVELAAEAGLPEGVIQVVTGSGSIVGEALGMHNDVEAISFTGSTEIGRKLLEYSAKSNLKKIVLELGGKSPMVVLDDVKDLSGAVTNALFASFWNAGQSCTANSRIFVPEARKEEFVELMQKELKKSWHMGDPLNPANNYGPMVGEAHFTTVMGFMEQSIKEGHRMITGGKAKEIDNGHYIEPTIFVDPAPESALMRTEIFGPLTSVIGVKSNEEAITKANDTEYGLQASLFTGDLRNAHKFARSLRAGTISINKYCEGDITTPFGGLKLSGFGGQDNAAAAHDQYTEVKTIFIDLES